MEEVFAQPAELAPAVGEELVLAAVGAAAVGLGFDSGPYVHYSKLKQNVKCGFWILSS